MRLHGEERSKLLSALKIAYGANESLLKQFVSFKLEVELLWIISNTGGVQQMASALIQWAEQEGRLPELICALREDKQGNLEVQAITGPILDAVTKRTKAGWYYPVDYFSAHLLDQKQVFLNRGLLRRKLKSLSEPEGSRLLAVHGRKRSGKSYSLQFIMYLCKDPGAHQVALVDVEELASPAQFTPYALLQNIAIQMVGNADTLPRQEEKMDANWQTMLASWVVNQTRQSDVLWWIVLDGFDHLNLPDATRQMVQTLMITAVRSAPRLRVVLLSCNEVMLPIKYRRLVEVEEIGEITPNDIHAFFQWLFERRKQVYNEEYQDTTIDTLTAKVLDKIAAYQGTPKYLCKLSAEVETMIHDLFFNESPL